MEQDGIIRFDEINIRIIIRDLLKNCVYLAMAAIIGIMAVSIYFNITYKPMYTASATLAVLSRNSNGSSYANLNTAMSMADVLSAVFSSDVVKEKAVEVAGEKALDTQIKAELIKETNLFELKVTAENPELAYDVINTVLNNYNNVSDYIFSNAVIEVIANPNVPVAPSNMINIDKYKKLGASACLLVAVIGYVVVALLRGTVKSVKEAERKIEGKCIAIISHEKKNRTLKSMIRNTTKGLLITSTTVGFNFREQFHKLAVRVEYYINKKHGKIIMVCSVAENEGKTTVAANLALALAEGERKVLLIDMDLMKPAQYKLFDIQNKQFGQYTDFLDESKEDSRFIRRDNKKNIYQMFIKNSVKDPQKLISSERFMYLIEKLRAAFDYIVIDVPPLFASPAALRINESCDASILVVRQDRVQASDINDAIDSLKEGNNNFIGYVLNDFDDKITGSIGYGKYGNYGKYGKYGEHKERGTV